ncbi:MAG: hypothetical protein WAT79_11745 [Saprospiraceae bacterium]
MKYLGIVILYLFFSPIFGQKTFQPKQEDPEFKGIIYRKENTGLFALHTNGYFISYHTGKIKTYYKTNYTSYEIGYLSDSREFKQNRNIPISVNRISRSFRFGKQNQIFILRAGKGQKRLISDKAKRRGLALGYNMQIGPTIAIVKPYYLELIYQKTVDNTVVLELREERYSEENAEKFLDYNSVFGGGSFANGLTELSIIPGLQGKLGLFFSPGAFEEFAKSIEVGVMADIYVRKVPIMVETAAVSNKSYFINLYANIEFGKRSN